MDYNQAIHFLFNSLPVFQNIGPGAYKPGLGTALELDRMTGNPTRHYMTIHIAGTNGKGSTAHSLAAVCRAAGYRTGLYTSPHLIDFRERIRVDGEMIPQSSVVDFVERMQGIDLRPSFFEMTTAMAFEHFEREKCDVAIIETGLGGRLDSTNIITPALSIITNIGLDHVALLGDTLEQIATEKAGIIKPGVPVVVGECATAGVRDVFAARAAELGCDILFAQDAEFFDNREETADAIVYTNTPWGDITCDLAGSCQWLNMRCVLAALTRFPLPVSPVAIRTGLSRVASSTGLMGRWMTVSRQPYTIADTGHNHHAWVHLAPKIAALPGHRHIILGFVSDKSLGQLLKLVASIPDATVHLTQASVERALPVGELARRAAEAGLTGFTTSSCVADAYEKARSLAAAGDSIFVGGSTFVVADLLSGALR